MRSIRFEHLRKTYAGSPALSDIDLTIEPDTLTVICGPPASGKSVLLRLLVGLEPPTAGRILFDDADITHLDAADRTIGYVPQSFALFPHMSVFDNVAYPLALQGAPRSEIARRVAQAAEILRITPLLRKHPSELSGGEKQRAAIARGITKDSHIFVLDDPLVGLDFKLRESLMEELVDMRAELGATFVYATADPLEALIMAEQLVVLDGGRVIDANHADTLYHDPRHLRAAELVGFPRCNVIHGELEAGICATPLLRFPVVVEASPTRDVAVVIRPEQITYNAARPATSSGEIRLLENLGAESVIHFTAAGQRLVTTAPTPAVAHFDLGDQFPFTLRPEGLLVFDRASGQRIGRGHA